MVVVIYLPIWYENFQNSSSGKCFLLGGGGGGEGGGVVGGFFFVAKKKNIINIFFFVFFFFFIIIYYIFLVFFCVFGGGGGGGEEQWRWVLLPYLSLSHTHTQLNRFCMGIFLKIENSKGALGGQCSMQKKKKYIVHIVVEVI